AGRDPRTRRAAWPPPPRRAGSPPPAPAPRTPRRSAAAAAARTAPPRARRRGSGSVRRPGASPSRPRPRPAVDLVEELLGAGDAGSAREGITDELRGLDRAVAELVDEHVPHHLAEVALVG